MSYFSTWNEKIEDTTDEKRFNDFVEHYYRTEQRAYDLILQGYLDMVLEGKATDLAERLEFAGDMVVFLGFLDGINNSLKNELDLENIVDDSEIRLEIDYAKLLYNMHDAKANWLFKLDSWANVFNEAEQEEIAKQFRTDHIAVSDKIGRNDPCPCGSGLKYKKCHGKNA